MSEKILYLHERVQICIENQYAKRIKIQPEIEENKYIYSKTLIEIKKINNDVDEINDDIKKIIKTMKNLVKIEKIIIKKKTIINVMLEYPMALYNVLYLFQYKKSLNNQLKEINDYINNLSSNVSELCDCKEYILNQIDETYKYLDLLLTRTTKMIKYNKNISMNINKLKIFDQEIKNKLLSLEV